MPPTPAVKTSPRSRAPLHALVLLGLFSASACVLEAEPESGVGSLQLALTSESSGVSYRLTDARFALTGPETKGFASSDEPVVNVALTPGSYMLELLEGYRLVRADDPQGEGVSARLLSENPVPLLVEPGVTTEVTLRFELADGTQVSNQRGSVSVQLDLNGEADAGARDLCLDGLRISELDYDQPSVDDAEFVEIVNTAACEAELATVTLELVNGGDGKVYASYALMEAGARLAPDGRLVLGDPGVLSGLAADVLRMPLKTAGLQNGPDGVRLVLGGRVLDGVAYEGVVAGTGEGSPTKADDAELALSRCPEDFDSGDNGLDFQLKAPTPGAENLCE